MTPTLPLPMGVEKLKASTADVECDTCLLLYKTANPHYIQMMDGENVIVSFAQLPLSFIVQGFGRRTITITITILCSLMRVVFVVLAWQWTAQFF